MHEKIKIVKSYLLSKQINGFLNISKIHPLYVTDYRNHQTLWEKS